MRDGPPQRPLSAPSPLSSRAAFEGTVNGLPPHAREAFEDAVLELVRTEKKWKKAYDRSPTSMPSVAMYANNAYMRELRRNAPPSADPPTRERSTSRGDVPRTVTAAEAMTNARTAIMAQDQEQFERLRARWERPAAGQRDSAAASARSSSARSSFDYPRENEMSDGGAFQAAQRAQYVWSTDNSRNPGQDQLSDALGFQAAEEARLERVTAGATGPTPTPVQEAEQAHHAWNNADFSNPGRESMSDGTAFLSARTTPQFGSTAPLSFAPPSPVTPVSPLPGSAVPATSGPPPLLSDEGRTILGGSMASTRSASASRGGDSPSRSTASVHAGQNTNTPAPRARRA
ncbi:hypothetical protein [Streptomyces sp. NPDC005784]|uniref:hypothetical protein n=1 Tax=Streptomyces sp. NPDC005784 TaxID=3364731 RepID=UPI0036A19EBE